MEEINPFFHEEHPLKLIDWETILGIIGVDCCDNEGKSGGGAVGCDICEEPLSNGDSAYACIQCRFFAHKLCSQLPYTINLPSLYQHPLRIEMFKSADFGLYFCYVCGQRITKGFSYFSNEKDDKGQFIACGKCSLVEFARKAEDDAIKEEAKIKLEHEGHPQHPLTLKLRPGSFHCDACNAKDKGLFYECDNCDFWIHKSCATLAPTIHLPHHHPEHPLVLVYSLPDRFYRYPCYCKFCKKYIRRDDWLYHCANCRYFSHIKCALNAQQLPSTPRDDPDTCAPSEDVNSLLHFPMSEAFANPLKLLLSENSARDDVEEPQSNNIMPNFNFGEPIEPVIVNHNVKIPRVIWDMLSLVSDGLKKSKKPIRASEGMGGAYFMQHPSGNKYVGVFKPMDEEPMAVNNPQGLPLSKNGEGLKKGTKVGEGALREVAAYILDHPLSGPRGIKNEFESGFAGVPPTVMVKCLSYEFHHPRGYDGGVENIKVGSLQMFFENGGCCEDMGPRDFPVEEVHKITVFDIRTANADRHAGNILMNREEGRIALIPIDHGYCLPENFKDCTFDWLYWPQARKPYSQEVLDYINSLDAEQDIALLNSYGWDLSLECARTFRISTMLLKKGAAKGLSPFVIGHIMCRERVDEESTIEKIVQKAHDSIVRGTNAAVFLITVSNIMDSELENICY